MLGLQRGIQSSSLLLVDQLLRDFFFFFFFIRTGVVARLGETRWVQLLVPGCTGADRVLPEHLMSVQ